jgi:hypothetical protein
MLVVFTNKIISLSFIGFYITMAAVLLFVNFQEISYNPPVYTVCPKKKYKYPLQQLSYCYKGTFFGTHCTGCPKKNEKPLK